MMKQMRSERGGTLVLYTVAMVGMMGMAALAIDLGMLRKARAEAQRAADAAALAGADAFRWDIPAAAKIDSARAFAYRAADTNYMNGVKFDTTSEITVWVIPDSVKVRVKARRASVPTWFARVFGITSFPVGAIAAAEVSNQGAGSTCVKPIAIPDLWDDTQDAGYPNGNHYYDPGETWLWETGVDTYAAAHTGGEGLGTGLGSDLRNNGVPFLRDWGRQIVMRSSVSEGDPNQPCPGDLQGNKCYVPGWWGLWGGNTPDMRDMIEGCASGVVTVGVTQPTESGWKQTLNTSVENVYNRDQGARWDPAATDPYNGKLGTVVGSASLDYRNSPRMWTMAMVHPDDVPQVPSDHDTQFNNFMVFFLEGCVDESGIGPIGMPCGTQSMLVGRFMGPGAGVATGPTSGTMIRILRLVE